MSEDLKFYQDLDAKLDKAVAAKQANRTSPEQREAVFGAPYVTKGESIMGSRPFMITKLVGMMTGVIPAEQCKIELDLCQRLRERNVAAKHLPSGIGSPGPSYDVCIGEELLSVDHYDGNFRHEVKSIMATGPVDRDEARWQVQKAYNYDQKTAQSFIDQSIGGSLVAPPEQGSLIALLRNKDALISAGAKVIPLPPQGQMEWPRETSASTVYHVGENTAGTETQVGTGKLTLKGKKLIGLVRVPNELIRFATISAETMIRNNLMKSMALQLDYDCLYGEGSDVIIEGLINVPNVQSIGTATLAPQDLMLFPSAIEQVNGEFEAYILNPKLFYNFVAARAGVYNGSGVVANGQFVYDQFRQLAGGHPKVIGGFPAVTTNQIPSNRGAGTGTTLWGGAWSDYILGMFGSIEFVSNDKGDGYLSDQSVIRAILTADGAPQHPALFAYDDGVSYTLGA